MMALGDGKGLITQRNDNRHVRVYIGLGIDDGWHARAGIDLASPAIVEKWLLDQFAGWRPELLGLITDIDRGYINRPLYALPVPHTWDHVPGVTLLGDAAHLMSPFLWSGCQPRHARCSLSAAIRAYEDVMLPRAAGAAEGIADAFASAGQDLGFFSH